MGTGARDTSVILTNKQVIQMDQEIATYAPSATPFITILQKAKGNKVVANGPKFEWLEDDTAPKWDAVNNGAGYLATDTSVVVDNGDYFNVGDIVKVPRTGETVLVTAVATNTLTITRGWGATAAALVDNDPVVIIGNVNAEFARTRNIKYTQETPCYNYTQIFRTPFGVSRTAQNTEMYGGQDLAYQTKKKGIEHAIEIARSLYFGGRKLDTTSGVKRATGGIIPTFVSQQYDAGGVLTMSEFNNSVCKPAFMYGNKNKLLLASPTLLGSMAEWANNKLQTKQGEDTFGLTVVKWISPFGTLDVVMEPLFEGAVYGGYGLILDMENIKYRPLKGSDTSLKTNIQENDEDGTKHEYLTEAGIQVKLPKTHFLVTGVTAGA